MAKLFINPDGANSQAQAVLAYLRGNSGIECSWDRESGQYLAEPEVDRWHNGRERGYVVHMRGHMYNNQINIAFFEHRNSNAICAVMFEAFTMNPPTLADIPEGVYLDKSDTSYDVGYGEAAKMANWINQQLIDFWKKSVK